MSDHERQETKCNGTSSFRPAPSALDPPALGACRQSAREVAFVKIAILDVDYRNGGARAACLLADEWSVQVPASAYFSDIDSVEEYEPGAFFRRELPCLLQVLKLLPSPPDIVVIDGYVWLSSSRRPGLGAHLYHAMGSTVPVIGVAKTAFHGAESCPIVVQVQRGSSKKPLFVTSVGVEPEVAGSWVQGMAGPHRIPTLLTAVDQLSRSSSTGQSAATGTCSHRVRP